MNGGQTSMKEIKNMKERIFSIALVMVMIASLFVGVTPMEVYAEEETATIQDLSSWVTIVGDQMIITPTDNTVEYVILSVRYEFFMDGYNSYKGQPVSGEGDFDSVSKYYADDEWYVKKGTTVRNFYENEMFYVATFDRKIASSSSYAITGVHAFKCVTTIPSVNAQPTSDSPTFDVQYGDVATYQWFVSDVEELVVSSVSGDNTIQPDLINWIYEDNIWKANTEVSSVPFEIELKKGDTIKFEFSPDSKISNITALEIMCFNNDQYEPVSYIPAEKFNDDGSVSFTATKDLVYSPSLWLDDSAAEACPYIKATVERRTPVDGQTTKTFTGEEGTYVCMASWGNYAMMSDAVIVSAASSGDTYIEEVTVKVDWNMVPTLEVGMSNMPEFDGDPATVEGKGVYGQVDYGWAIQVDDSFKTSDKNYNDGIDRYKQNYGGWAPLDFVFENDSTYRINEEDTYALWVYVGKDEGYTFGEYGSGAYKGAVNSNVDFVGGFPDDIGMVAFFKLGTLAEMEEEKGTEKPSVHTHSLTIVPEKAATCTETGNKAYYTCSGCDDLFADAKGTTTTTADAVKIAALGHDWTGKWTIIKEATATEEGKKETLCERDCGQKKVAIIPVTGTKDDNGNLEKDAEVEPEAPIDEVTLNNSKKELLEAGNIFKDAEKAQIENGADARVWLEISKTDESGIASTDKSKIEQEANKIMGDKSIITYFDADLFKQVGTYEKTPVPEPGIAIKITVKIPDKLLNSDKTVSREYKIIRLHKGQVDLINGTFDAKTGEFTFESDKFSTYAIVYKDVPVNDNTNPTPGDTDVIKPETPDTGDSNAAQYSFVLMLLSGLGMIICSSKKKILNKES